MPFEEKEPSNLRIIIDAFIEIFRPYNPEKSVNITEYLRTTLSNMRYKAFIYASIPIMIALFIAFIDGLLSWLSLELVRRDIIADVIVILYMIGILLLIHFYPLFHQGYKNYQEVRCPKCGGYTPFYKWQCPGCGKVHENRHIFLNCNGCAMKVGKLHKNLQSIKCINDKCRYDLYFYEPYEGGFNEHSFRGEE